MTQLSSLSGQLFAFVSGTASWNVAADEDKKKIDGLVNEWLNEI